MGCTRTGRSGWTVLACLLLSLGGCAGNGNGLDANGNPLTQGSAAQTPLTADFNSIQDHILTPICSVCHVGGGAPQGLRLDEANSYGLLVGVPSTEAPSVLRVKPGDPDNSYIIQKLEGHAAVGAQMPFGGPYLSKDTIAFVRQWISDGAQPSAAATALAHAAVLAVVTSAPGDHESMSQPPPQIMLGFSRALDASRIDASSMRLQRMSSTATAEGEDTATAAVQEVPGRIALVAQNPRALLMWPAQVLAPGRYRILQEAAPGARVVASFDIETAP